MIMIPEWYHIIVYKTFVFDFIFCWRWPRGFLFCSSSHLTCHSMCRVMFLCSVASASAHIRTLYTVSQCHDSNNNNEWPVSISSQPHLRLRPVTAASVPAYRCARSQRKGCAHILNSQTPLQIRVSRALETCEERISSGDSKWQLAHHHSIFCLTPTTLHLHSD